MRGRILGISLVVSMLFFKPLAFAQKNQDETFIWAVQNGDIEAVKASLASGADVNKKDSRGWTALMQAALYNHIDIVRLLLSDGAQVDAEDDAEDTAWILAAELGHVELADMLKEAGASERFDSLEWSDSYSFRKESAQTIIADSYKWEKNWAMLGFQADPPKIDFNKYVIAAVFLGVRPTGGYGVRFGKPYQEGGKMIIPYEEVKPAPGQFVTQALTQPYQMKVFPRNGEAVLRGNNAGGE